MNTYYFEMSKATSTKSIKASTDEEAMRLICERFDTTQLMEVYKEDAQGKQTPVYKRQPS